MRNSLAALEGAHNRGVERIRFIDGQRSAPNATRDFRPAFGGRGGACRRVFRCAGFAGDRDSAGYATSAWPPLGLALAAVLLLGNRVWPAIWLGAAAVNLTVQSSVIAAIFIGSGNALEAVVGATLVRRFIGVPRRFERGEDVFVFVAIAAAAATVAATIGASSIAASGAIGIRVGNAGFDEHLVKPVDPTTLEALLQSKATARGAYPTTDQKEGPTS